MLRFRVWDSEKKRFIFKGESSVVMSQNGELMQLSPADWIIDKHVMDENYIPMQSTGLFDSNNKEIFESDIIAFSHKDFDSLNTLIVDNVRDFLIDISYFHRIEPNQYTNVGKIIGNIYENKDIIEVIFGELKIKLLKVIKNPELLEKIK